MERDSRDLPEPATINTITTLDQAVNSTMFKGAFGKGNERAEIGTKIPLYDVLVKIFSITENCQLLTCMDYTLQSSWRH